MRIPTTGGKEERLDAVRWVLLSVCERLTESKATDREDERACGMGW
jgi:hypothetical protein